MKDIGIVICNYNKEDYIVNCIKTVLQSSIQNFDIYVVDNASTDGSVDKIRAEFGDKVKLIINQENLGGSGGFNAGLCEALKYDYKYIMLLDNDIIVDQCAVEELYQFLEHHKEVGMVGSKVYFMDYPKRIWGYGGMISFEKFGQEDNYKNCTDSESIPEVLYCDYVAACSLMVTTEAIRNVGILPKDNFIYWDDMEWGYRFNQAGYKVAVCGKSKIWHKAGGRNAGDTFINYYMWRNRFRFFLKILPKDKREHFAETILTDMFRLIYSCNLKGEQSIIKSVMYALDDAVHNVTGKAANHKILSRNNTGDRLTQAVENANSVLIMFNGNFEGLGNIIRKIETKDTNRLITISMANCDMDFGKVQEQFPNCVVLMEYEPENYGFHLKMCNHIFDIRKEDGEDIYVDSWCNIISDESDFKYCINFKQSLDLFLNCSKIFLINY